jgi:DNA-binding transcriptional regulator YiaG
MPNLATSLRFEIRRQAAKAVKKTLRSLRKAERGIRSLRVLSREQRKAMAALERRIERLKKRAVAGTGRVRGAFAPESIRALRARFEMTRAQFSKLLSVSPGSIFGWEKGRSAPRGKSRALIAKARTLSPRAAQARLTGTAKGRSRRRRARG